MFVYKMVCILITVYGQHECWAAGTEDFEPDVLPDDERRWGRTNDSRPVFEYPVLFREHIFTELSEKGREMFFALNIHPNCVEKKGQCIPRGKCVDMKMIYISRVCYHRDLVCCFDDTIHFPVVEILTKSHGTTTEGPTPSAEATEAPEAT